jgi:hypothetical protein
MRFVSKSLGRTVIKIGRNLEISWNKGKKMERKYGEEKEIVCDKKEV